MRALKPGIQKDRGVKGEHVMWSNKLKPRKKDGTKHGKEDSLTEGVGSNNEEKNLLVPSDTRDIGPNGKRPRLRMSYGAVRF